MALYELGRTRQRLQPRIDEFSQPLFGGGSGGFASQPVQASEPSGAFGGGTLGNVGTVLSALSALRSAQQSGLLDEISGFLPSGVRDVFGQLFGGGPTPGTAGQITAQGLGALEGGGSGPSLPPAPPVSALRGVTSTPTTTPTGNLPVTTTPVPTSAASQLNQAQAAADFFNAPGALASVTNLTAPQTASSAAQTIAGLNAGARSSLGALAANPQEAAAVANFLNASGAAPAAATTAAPLTTGGLPVAGLGVPSAAAAQFAATAGPAGGFAGLPVTGAALPAAGGIGASLAAAAPFLIPGAIAALPLVANLLKGEDNTALARTQATDKVVELLRSGNNLERAKALLGLPNTFEDPSPSTKAKFDFVEGAINRAGGIAALPPASQEVLRSALARRAADRIREQRAAAERLGAPLLPQQAPPPRPPFPRAEGPNLSVAGVIHPQSPPTPPFSIDFGTAFAGGEGQTFGDTLAGQLIRQGLTPQQAEERLQVVGSGGP